METLSPATQNLPHSPGLNSVRRNLNSSFHGDENRSLRKGNLNLVVNTKKGICKRKHYYYESYSDSSPEKELVVEGKRTIKPPAKFSIDDMPSPRPVHRHLTRTKPVHSPTQSKPSTPSSVSKKGCGKSKFYYYESYSDSEGSGDENLIVNGKRSAKPPALFSLEMGSKKLHSTPSKDFEKLKISSGTKSPRKRRNTGMISYYEPAIENSSDDCLTPTKKPVRSSSRRYQPVQVTPLKAELEKLAISRAKKTAKKISPIPNSLESEDSESDFALEKKVTRKRKNDKAVNKVADVSTPKKSPPKPANARSSKSTLMTPLKNKHLLIEISTPRTPRREPGSATKGTPKSTLKLIREGVITPSVGSRRNTGAQDTTPLMMARSQLHVAFVPKSLPCREKEHKEILGFLEGKLVDGCGGCMYISGVPGTGKTATVTSVVNFLLESSKQGDLPKFDYVNVNGMKLTEPRQAYVEIVKQLTQKTMTWQQALDFLEDKFTKKSKKTRLPVILIIDELDIICNKRQDVVYNLLDWPTKANNQLIVITIANTMDLPERLLMNRVTSRLGLTRLTFQAYTHKQLQEIVMMRLSGTDSFNPDAVQLVARKVASVSGDARRALDICRRAAEIAETEGDDTLVSMVHVNEALKMMMTQPKVRAIKHCSRLEQYLLQAVVAEVERTGIEETVFSNVYKMLVSLSALNGFAITSISIALASVAKLSACRLLLVDPKSSDIYRKIILNVSPDDVYYALKDE